MMMMITDSKQGHKMKEEEGLGLQYDEDDRCTHYERGINMFLLLFFSQLPARLIHYGLCP